MFTDKLDRKLIEGIKVRIQNLKSRAELNGREGFTCKFHADKGRWEVRVNVDGKNSSIAVKSENLDPLSAPALIIRPTDKVSELPKCIQVI